jgi:hypothetical protein
LGVLVLITTGSGTKVSVDFDQPAVERVARLAFQQRPAVVFARALSRIGRGYVGPLVEALQSIADTRADGPFIGDDTTQLGELDLGMEVRLAIEGIFGKHDAKKSVRSNRTGMRTRTGTPHPALRGVWAFGNSRPAPPGLVKLKLRSYDNSAPRTWLVLDCPAARPPEELIAGGPPPAITSAGAVADQVELIRWLGEHLYTDGWGRRECAAYLAEHGWAPPAVRARRPVTVVKGKVVHPPVLPLRSGYAGRNDGRRALNAFLRHLDFYETGELVVNLPDGGEPVRLTGVLPLDGRPWITATQARRIRRAEARRHTRPREKHLFAGLPVTVDGEPTVLHPRIRKSDETLVYYFRRAENPRRPVASPRAAAVPPLPATVVAQWYADGLAELALPLSLRLAERPAAAAPWEAQIRVLHAEIDKLEADQEKRKPELDPATRTENPATVRFITCFEQTAVELLRKRDELAAAHAQQQLHGPAWPLSGTPLSKLVEFVAALPQPKDRGHRLLLRELTASLTITTSKRPSTGRRPAHQLTGELTLPVQDGTNIWRAVSRHTWTGGAVRRAPARLADAIAALYAGLTLAETLGADWMRWLPAVRAALGCTGPAQFQFAHARDARLLRLGMAVIYPRRTVVPLATEPEQIVRYALPPLDLADLRGLARRLGEPVALLRAIQKAYTPLDRQPRWIRNASPAVAAPTRPRPATADCCPSDRCPRSSGRGRPSPPTGTGWPANGSRSPAASRR